MPKCPKLPKAIMLLAMFLVLPGCGGAYDASVEGLVTLDGEPVPAGSISFVPADGGPTAYARSDQSGMYEVYTGSESGLKPGQYGVTVVARASSEQTHNPLGGPNPGKQLTPPWYKSSKYTPLSYKVEPGSNSINLELSSKPPAAWEPSKRKRR